MYDLYGKEAFVKNNLVRRWIQHQSEPCRVVIFLHKTLALKILK
jgi:hypothetical protein